MELFTPNYLCENVTLMGKNCDAIPIQPFQRQYYGRVA